MFLGGCGVIGVFVWAWSSGKILYLCGCFNKESIFYISVL